MLIEQIQQVRITGLGVLLDEVADRNTDHLGGLTDVQLAVQIPDIDRSQSAAPEQQIGSLTPTQFVAQGREDLLFGGASLKSVRRILNRLVKELASQIVLAILVLASHLFQVGHNRFVGDLDPEFIGFTVQQFRNDRVDAGIPAVVEHRRSCRPRTKLLHHRANWIGSKVDEADHPIGDALIQNSLAQIVR